MLFFLLLFLFFFFFFFFLLINVVKGVNDFNVVNAVAAVNG